MVEKSLIAEYYKNKNIFVTGGSGFIGKCLIEKLLRSCPDLGNIYMLLRPRKGKSIEERLDKILSNILFDQIRKKNPSILKKIIPVGGDVARLGLGLSTEDRQTLIDNVNIIFHIAASVRFDDSLKDAILINVRSSREVAELALETKHLSVLLHTSTTYCNIDKKVVDEILYPSYGNWRDAIMVAEECDESILEALTAKYISPFPNTYTFTKLLAENCINELCVGKVPTVIYRPSVVVSSLEEPFPGYVDNFNGPIGLLLAGGSGMLRVFYGDENVKTDYIPVDITIKAMIVAVWDKAKNAKDDLAIYNGSKNDLFPVKQGYLVEAGKKLYWDVPFQRKIWFPNNSTASCVYEYYLYVILCHVLPAIFLDLVLRVAGHKPSFFQIQRKIYIANMALSHFVFNEWKFSNDKLMALNGKIPSDIDLKLFGFQREGDMTHEDIYNFYKVGCRMAKHLLLKEEFETSAQTVVNTKRMYYLDIFVRTVFWIAMAYLAFYKFNILCVLCKGIRSHWTSL